MPGRPAAKLFLIVTRSLPAELLLLSLVGCTSAPTLKLDSTRRTPRELIGQSSVIVVGVITDIRILGPSRTTVDGVLYQAWRIDVEREAALDRDRCLQLR